ncbi:S8 family serine peptidase [Desulfobacula sp.]|uniref:S8 family serine peptidase n=1 Tax=Desulfobacula sp. TaxID=2593537 RepID=UPI002626DD48|nr:S8 family serine peptidase [Desulfobacula sp.]
MKQTVHILILIAAILCPAPRGYASPCPDMNIQVKDHRISINIKEQPLNCVLDQLSRQTGIRIKLWQDIKKPLTLNLTQLPMTDFFHTLGEGNALVYTYLPEKKEYRLIGVNMAASAPGTSLENPQQKNSTPIQPHIKTSVRPGELLIRFKAHVSENQINRLHHFLGSKILKQVPPLHLYRVRIDSHLSMDTAIQMYMATGLVRTAEHHAVRTLHQQIPNDPKFSQQWGLTAIKAPDAWDISQGSEDIIIAVIDTGVDFLHPDLQKNIWINQTEATGQEGVDDDNNGYTDDIYGWDFADNDHTPFDADGHGTHIAGIIGAVTDNATGIAGVCPRVKIMVLKVQGDDSDDMDTTDIIEAVDYARHQGAHIINCSFGGTLFQTEELIAFERFQNENNGLVICSAGNDAINIDINPLYPACYDLPGILSVAASEQKLPGQYVLAEFSNFGAANADVMAPGKDILSTLPETVITQAYLTMGTPLTSFPAQGLTFAATTDDDGITRSLVDCGYGYPDEIPGIINNAIALIKRGNRDGIPFYFYQKIAHVQQQGAVGAVIYNNAPGAFAGTLVTPQDWIPAISVSQETGILLKSSLPAPVTLVNRVDDSTDPYGQKSGTSMATGFVSGAAGLLSARMLKEPFARLKALLLNRVDIIDATDGTLLSKGQINILKALAELPLPGDVDNDLKQTPEDTLVGLKILSGTSSDAVSQDIPHWDANNDGRLDFSEPIHVLQKKTD